MFRILLLFLLLLSFNCLSIAQTIKGKIADAETGETLTGACVYVKEINDGTVSLPDGRYSIKVSSGKYTLVCRYLGYQPMEKTVTVKNVDVTVDFPLNPDYSQSYRFFVRENTGFYW
jgi:hypothetical protein